MRAELVVSDDVAGEAANRIAEVAAAGGHVCLSGGSTPRRAYAQLAALGGDLSRATFWFGDERCVPPDDERSNYRMARESLLDAVSSGPRVVRMRGELGPHDGAEDYERQLRQAFGGGPPAFDLALLGLGPDGHTASLFPGQPALGERERWCVGVEEAGMDPRVARITLTLPVFAAAREALFLVEGESKAEPLVRALVEEPSPETPASLVGPASGRLVVLCDAAAAALVQDAA
jgi:6-phosphogluconolactonase